MLTSNHNLLIGLVILVLFYFFIKYQMSNLIDEKIEKSHKKIIKKIYSMYKKFNQHEQSQQEYNQQQHFQNSYIAQQPINAEKNTNQIIEENNNNENTDDDSIEDIGYSGNQGNEYATFNN